jgi:hypothetical protein
MEVLLVMEIYTNKLYTLIIHKNNFNKINFIILKQNMIFHQIYYIIGNFLHVLKYVNLNDKIDILIKKFSLKQGFRFYQTNFIK